MMVFRSLIFFIISAVIFTVFSIYKEKIYSYTMAMALYPMTTYMPLIISFLKKKNFTANQIFVVNNLLCMFWGFIFFYLILWYIFLFIIFFIFLFLSINVIMFCNFIPFIVAAVVFTTLLIIYQEKIYFYTVAMALYPITTYMPLIISFLKKKNFATNQIVAVRILLSTFWGFIFFYLIVCCILIFINFFIFLFLSTNMIIFRSFMFFITATIIFTTLLIIYVEKLYFFAITMALHPVTAYMPFIISFLKKKDFTTDQIAVIINLLSMFWGFIFFNLIMGYILVFINFFIFLFLSSHVIMFHTFVFFVTATIFFTTLLIYQEKIYLHGVALALYPMTTYTPLIISFLKKKNFTANQIAFITTLLFMFWGFIFFSILICHIFLFINFVIFLFLSTHTIIFRTFVFCVTATIFFTTLLIYQEKIYLHGVALALYPMTTYTPLIISFLKKKNFTANQIAFITTLFFMFWGFIFFNILICHIFLFINFFIFLFFIT